MTRQTTNQARQRAKIKQRRRRRGPPEPQHGERSQGGVKIRSTAAWMAYRAYHKILVGEQRRLEAMRQEWHKRAAEKRAIREGLRR